eukprot:3599877-Rhodomonas_salina.1
MFSSAGRQFCLAQNSADLEVQSHFLTNLAHNTHIAPPNTRRGGTQPPPTALETAPARPRKPLPLPLTPSRSLALQTIISITQARPHSGNMCLPPCVHTVRAHACTERVRRLERKKGDVSTQLPLLSRAPTLSERVHDRTRALIAVTDTRAVTDARYPLIVADAEVLHLAVAQVTARHDVELAHDSARHMARLSTSGRNVSA